MYQEVIRKTNHSSLLNKSIMKIIIGKIKEGKLFRKEQWLNHDVYFRHDTSFRTKEVEFVSISIVDFEIKYSLTTRKSGKVVRHEEIVFTFDSIEEMESEMGADFTNIYLSLRGNNND